jgi:hypothetical protein
MPGRFLAPVTLDIFKDRLELAEYKEWLDSHAEFSESKAVEFLKTRPNLCLLIQPASGKGFANVLKHEVTLQGAFRADLVTGSTVSRNFVLVEFEGGTKDSIFNGKRGTGQMRDWSRDVERAFSQVTDWTWVKNDSQHSVLYRNIFGLDHFSETYLIVCGRNAFLNPTSQSRLHWRSEKTTIAACPNTKPVRPGFFRILFPYFVGRRSCRGIPGGGASDGRRAVAEPR